MDKEWKIKFYLFLATFLIYLFYFHDLFSHINSVLCGITGDALKNYYTYFYHTVHDKKIFHFEGMNYPFGEHPVFTDCQPLLTIIFRFLPFTHPYLAGVLHSLLFLSFIFTPLVLYSILKIITHQRSASFFLAIAITLISPQFAKIGGGHHGLSYGLVIPLSVLGLLKYMNNPRIKILWLLSIYCFFLFLIHPYLGFNAALLHLITILIWELSQRKKLTFKQKLFAPVVAGILPIITFQVLMRLTDNHKNRINEPFGKNTLVENIDSLLSPDFGPYKEFLEKIFTHKTTHLETHSYLGVALMLLCLFLLIVCIVKRKLPKVPSSLFALFSAAFILLMLSFGLHNVILDKLNISIPALNQFRAVSRFGWTFYYVIPLFVFSALASIINNDKIKSSQKIWLSVAFLYFTITFTEAHDYLSFNATQFWKDKNLFRADLLTEEENRSVEYLKQLKPQAIIALPVFYAGSEMYARTGADASIIPSLMFSYHTQLPVLGGMMSRTSISETEEALSILNSYKKDKNLFRLCSSSDFAVIKTNDELWSDESRFWNKCTASLSTTHYTLGSVSMEKIKERNKDSLISYLNDSLSLKKQFIYIPDKNEPPFRSANMNQDFSIVRLDSTNLIPGKYLLSFHYYYSKHPYHNETLHLLILKKEKEGEVWHHLQAVRLLSGFYKDFGVFEFPLEMNKHDQLHVTLKGLTDQDFYIRNFMIRPYDRTIITPQGNDTLINNFPVYAD